MFIYDVLLRDVFSSTFLSHNLVSDDSVLSSIFCSAGDAIKNVWTLFENYVV